MATDRVLVEVVRNLTDMQRGDQAWVDDSERVRGMVEGGNWKIIDREIKATAKKVTDRVTDPDQPK